MDRYFESWPSFYSLPMSASMEDLGRCLDLRYVKPTSLELEEEKGTNETTSTSAMPVTVREGEEKDIDCCIVEEQTKNLNETYYLSVSTSTEKLNAWVDSLLTNSTSATPIIVREGEEKNDCCIVGVLPSLQQTQHSVLQTTENSNEAYLKQKLGIEVSTYLQYQESVKTGLSVGESSRNQSIVNTEATRQSDEYMDVKEAKLKKRRESNRLAARRIREKKKDQMKKLQQKISMLETILASQNAAAAVEVSQCNERVASMENKVKMKDDWIETVETSLRMVYGKTTFELVSMAIALSGSAQPAETEAAAAAEIV